MKNPPHPGELVRYDCLEPLGLSISKGAEVLGISRHTLARLIHGHAAITPETAIRLEKAFGGTAEAWLRMQLAYDLAQLAEKAEAIHSQRYQLA